MPAEDIVQANGTTCSSSHDATDTQKCPKAMDVSINSMWATNLFNVPGEWIQLDFIDIRTVFQIDIYPLCKNGSQCIELDLRFSAGEISTVSN